MTAFSCELTLHWNSHASSENGIQIERATLGKPYSIIANVSQSTTTFTDFREDHSIEYWYRVRSFDLAGEVGKTTFFYQAKGYAPLQELSSGYFPENDAESYTNWAIRQYQIATPQSLTLAWSDNSENEAGFQVESSLDGENFEIIARTSANTTTFLDEIEDYHIERWYRVCAYNVAGKSGYTNIIHKPENITVSGAEPTIDYYAANIDQDFVEPSKLPKLEHSLARSGVSHIFTQTLSSSAYGVSYRLFSSIDLKLWEELCYESETVEEDTDSREFLIRTSNSSDADNRYYKLEIRHDSTRPTLSSENNAL